MGEVGRSERVGGQDAFVVGNAKTSGRTDLGVVILTARWRSGARVHD